MPINLAEIPAATDAYIDDQVTVTIKRVTRNLEPDEDGTFTVEITNGPVRLRELVLHVISDDPSNVQLMPPGSALMHPTAANDRDDPRLSRSQPVGEMFVFFLSDDPAVPPSSVLEPNEVREHEFIYRAISAGAATISCHVHASVDVDDLFPRSSGSNGSKSVTVRS